MYITICKVDDQCNEAMHEAGHSKLVLWDNPEGWGGEGGEKGGSDGGTQVHSWLFHGKTHNIIVISLQLK